MKVKHWLILSGVALLLIMATTIGVQRYIIKLRTQESNARLDAFREFKSELKIKRAADSTQFAELKAMQLSKSEIKELFPDVEGRLDLIDKKLRNMESLITVGTNQQYNIHTTLRDSTVMDTVKVKVASYSDKWIKFNQLIYPNNSLETKIETRDSLDIDLEKGRRENKFLIFRYGAKEYPIIIKNSNPHSKLIYARYLKVRNNKIQK
jgi:hypothetical protein